MADTEQIRTLLEDLMEVLHLQAKEFERLIAHVERQTAHLGYRNQLPLVVSELSELHQRVKNL
jgi:hypothetical protein